MLNRRSLLKGVLAAGICAAALSPSSVLAQSGPTVITLEQVSPGKFRMPSGFSASIDAGRQTALIQASEKALKIAQRDALSVPKANGLLSKMLRPLTMVRSLSNTLLRDLLAVGLIAGMTWALSDGSIVQDLTGTGQLERTDNSCGVASSYPLLPGSVTNVSTGMFRNSSNQIVAYSRQVVQTSGGTATAPAGWSWSYQRNVKSLGGGQYLTEVWFSRQVNSSNCANFKYPVPAPITPGTVVPADANIPDPALDNLPDQLIKIGAPIPLPTIPPGTQVEDPGTMVPAPGINVPWPGGTVPATSWDGAFSPGLQDPVFMFPPGTIEGTDPGGEVPGGEVPGGETPGGNGTLPDFTAPALPGFPSITPVDWWPSPFSAPTLSATCTNPGGSLASLGNVTIPLCDMVDQMAPVLRPLVAGSALVAAGKIILDV